MGLVPDRITYRMERRSELQPEDGRQPRDEVDGEDRWVRPQRLHHELVADAELPRQLAIAQAGD